MTTRTSRRLARLGPRPLSWLGLLAVVLLLLPLAACAGGSDDSGATAGGDSSGSAAGGAADLDADPGAEAESSLADEAASGDAGGDRSTASAVRGRSEPLQRAVVSTGTVSLRSDDVARDRAEALRLVATYGGLVAAEETGTDDDGRARFAVLTLRVPSARFDDAMAALAEVGSLVEQARSSEDVTTEVVDVQARVRAQDRSVRRIEALLAEATSLREVISIEGDLARRQADLDSLRAQQAYLDDQTSLSTISLSIDAAEERRAAPPAEGDGFLAGLRGGWSALGESAAVLLTVVGTVLPFAVLAGLVVVPTAAVVRRRRSRTVETA